VIHFIKTIHFQYDGRCLHISSIEISSLFVFKESKGNAMAHLTASRTLPVAGRSTTARCLGDRLAAVFAVWRQRRALASLPDHLRQDVGLTEAEIDREARRHSGTSRTTGGSEPGSAWPATPRKTPTR
jgi:hypothetical protein